MPSYRTHGWKKHGSYGRRKKSLLSYVLKKLNISKGTLIKNLILLCIALGFLGSLFILGLFAFVSRDLPDPNTLTEREISQTTKIYDNTGEHLLYEIFGEENRTLVKLQEGFCVDDDQLQLDENGIPLFAVQAVITAEDRKFCEHSGFDATGLARSVLKNIFTGSRVGGSTLTQQLVKNAILSNEKTYIRKIKELILSLELERRYSKDELLQIYFNEIPYGSTYYGIEAASQNYFDKSVYEITLAEAATLAALPQAPTFYLNNPDYLIARRDWILEEMVDLEFISEEEAEVAMQEETTVSVSVGNITAPHFVFYVKELLEEQFDQRTVEEGGLKVITTIDYEMQLIAEEEVLEGVDERGEQYHFTNAALVAIDPNNGQILSMVGSKDFFDDDIDGQVNVATRLRQPGSSFKPIVYSKGFEMGYTPNTVLWDVVTSFATDTEEYTPHNYDLEERGPVRLREALQGSLNIPAVKMSYLVGVENTIDFARLLGYTSFEDYSDYGLSLVLGGGEVQLLEHVGAYGVFANEGTFHEPVSILRVEDAYGEILYEWEEEKGEQVLDENIARTISHVLSDNDARSYVFGASSYLQLGDRPVAAKTGTTNDYRDAWLVGYTPSLAVGVWAGNNDNSAMSEGAGGSNVAGPIWNGFFQRALAETEIESFVAPDIPVTGKAVLDGSLGSTTVIIDITTGKLATEYTPDSQKEERIYVEYHSLLHYVDPSDPLGAIPSDPTDNPDYEAWEAAITTWIQTEEEKTGTIIVQGDPPTEYDDVHGPEFFPNISITSPNNNETFEDRSISISVDTDAERGVSRVEYYLDSYYLGSNTNSPYQLNTTLPNTISRGYHTLQAVAYDDVDNNGSDSVRIQIEANPLSENFEILDPTNGQTIIKTQEGYTIVLSLENPSDYTSVSLYEELMGSGTKSLVNTITDPNSPFITLTWTLPEAGSWALSAKALPRSGGEMIDTVGIVISVVEGDVQEVVVEESVDEEASEEIVEDVFVAEEDLNPFE